MGRGRDWETGRRLTTQFPSPTPPVCPSPGPLVIPQSVFDDGVGLDLDEPFGVNEADDLHDRVGGPHVAEELAVHTPHALPVLYAREHDARAHNVGEPRAQTFEGARDYLEAAAGLRPPRPGRRRLTLPAHARRC